MQKIFIADYSQDLLFLLSGALRARYAVHTFDDGAQLLTQLREIRPDVLVLDLLLTQVNGLGVLKVIQEEQLCSAVVVVSRFISDYILDMLKQYPVVFVAMKPYSLESIIDQIDDLCAGLAGAPEAQIDPHCVVSGILLALNIPTHKKGFRYCRESILMMADNPSLQLTKEVYPTLAKEYSTSSAAVEKAIRAAVDSGWENRNDHVWQQYFLPAPNGMIPRPTNTQFLTRLTDAVAIERRGHTLAGGR